jgi:hypothetical protein
MNTNDLIDSLADGVRPVAPLPSPGRRAVAWLMGGALYVAAVIALMSRGASPNAWTIGFWLPQAAAVVASLLAVRAAFASVVPGRQARALVWAIAAGGVWTASLFVTPGTVDFAAVGAARHEWICVGVTLLGGVPLMIALAVMLRRGAALSPATTAALAAVAVGLLANVAACWSLPHGNDAVTWVWHGGTIAAGAAAFGALGRRVFRWRGVQPER